MIYLASPYSHPNAQIREQRFHDACRTTAELMRAGHVVFSPIAHGHPICSHGLPIDWTFWEQIDRAFIVRCEEMVVLTLDGWRDSEGVQAEIRIAMELEKTVRFIRAFRSEITESPSLGVGVA